MAGVKVLAKCGVFRRSKLIDANLLLTPSHDFLAPKAQFRN
jgi:hypothetical protein